jgi:hypothetical protein
MFMLVFESLCDGLTVMEGLLDSETFEGRYSKNISGGILILRWCLFSLVKEKVGIYSTPTFPGISNEAQVALLYRCQNLN